MSFKVFPCEGKIPLIKDWQSEASADPEQHKLWANLFRGRLTHWGIPTGPTNGILVLDVDMKGNGHETLKSLDLPPTMWQRTPSGGAHYFFKYPADGRRYGNKVKFLGGLDARGEGGYVVYYGSEGTELADAPAWFTSAYNDRPVQAQPPPGQVQTAVKVSPEIAGRLITESLDRLKNAAQGERNHTLNLEAFKLGQLVASQSITFEYAYEALWRAAMTVGLESHESKATIMSGLSGGHKKPIADPFQSTQPLPHFPIPNHDAKWAPEKTTREELFDHAHLKKRQLFQDWSTEDICLTTADGGTGKTTLKLFEAICLALGERFLGFNCISPGGKTLFITGEDTDKKLKAMLGQILKAMGLTADPSHNAKIQIVLDSIYIKKDTDLCLIVKDQRSGFLSLNPQALAKVLQAVEQIRPQMIVFDPISSFWGSEAALNDMAKAVSKFMAELSERASACVEMINHMGKQSSSNKDMSQFAGRGGTGLPSHARVSRTLRSISDKEYSDLTGESLGEKQSAMLCNVNKFSDGSPLYNKPFLILRDGFLFSRKVMTDAKAREAEEKLTDIERVFQFIKESREADKFPTRSVTIAYFKTCGNPIPKTRVEGTLDLLQWDGHMGEKIKLVENPDEVAGGKVYVICGMDGKE